jgi:hypothetical protein
VATFQIACETRESVVASQRLTRAIHEEMLKMKESVLEWQQCTREEALSGKGWLQKFLHEQLKGRACPSLVCTIPRAIAFRKSWT